MPLFINDNGMDTRFLCKESKEHLKKHLSEQNAFSKIVSFNSLVDNGLGSEKDILEGLKQIEGAHAKRMKERAKIAKNNLVKSLWGLSILLAVILILVPVAVFVPAIAVMVTAAMAALLVAGPWVLPLLITAGIVISLSVIAPSLIFAWKKYKNTRAHNKSIGIVEELTSKSNQLDDLFSDSDEDDSESESDTETFSSRKSSIYSEDSIETETVFPSKETINYDSLANQLKIALEWRQAQLSENPNADVSYDAYLQHCPKGDQVDGIYDQINATQFEKLYNELESSNIEKINASLVETTLNAINTIESKIKLDQNLASSSLFRSNDDSLEDPLTENQALNKSRSFS